MKVSTSSPTLGRPQLLAPHSFAVQRPPLIPSGRIVSDLRDGKILSTRDLNKLKGDYKAARALAKADSQFSKVFLRANGMEQSEIVQLNTEGAPDNQYSQYADFFRRTGRPPLGPAPEIISALTSGHVLITRDYERLKNDYQAALALAHVDPKFARLLSKAQNPSRHEIKMGKVPKLMDIEIKFHGIGDRADPIREAQVVQWYHLYKRRFGVNGVNGPVAAPVAGPFAGALSKRGGLRSDYGVTFAAQANRVSSSSAASAGSAAAAEAAEAAQGAFMVATQTAAVAHDGVTAAERARAAALEARDAAVEARKAISDWQPLETVPSWMLAAERGSSFGKSTPSLSHPRQRRVGWGRDAPSPKPGPGTTPSLGAATVPY